MVKKEDIEMYLRGMLAQVETIYDKPMNYIYKDNLIKLFLKRVYKEEK